MKKKVWSFAFVLLAALLLPFVGARVYAAGAQVVSIAIKDMPTKTEYYVGEYLNTNGLAVRATLSDGSTVDVTSIQYTDCTPWQFTEDGTQQVTVRYGGQTATYTVNVKLKPQVVAQPQNVTTEIGKTVSFTYNVTGKNVVYQWYYKKNGSSDWSLWKGHTTSTTTAQTNATWNHMRLYCTAVDAYGNRFTSRTASVTLKDVLEIYQQPYGISVSTGADATFSLKSYGKALSYQWYYQKAGDASPTMWKGKNTAEITFTADRSWNKATAYCVVTDGSGKSVTSNTVGIKIKDVLEIISSPGNVSLQSGKNGYFSVSVQGINVQYQWYYKKKGAASWSIWKGHTMRDVTAPSNDSWSGMQVRCRVTDDSGEVLYSNPAVITIIGKTELVESPANITVKPGGTASFTVKASGTGLSYQWYYKKKGASSWSIWKGHTAASTSAVANDTWNGMQVRCVIKDGNGTSLTSGIATVTVKRTALAITVQPQDTNAAVGGNVSFAVKAQGDGLSYQWYYKKKGASSWSIWKGHTAASTTAAANDTWDGMQVYCAVKDSYGGSLSSAAAKITLVKQIITVTSQPKNVTTKANHKVTFSVAAKGSGLSYQWYYKKKAATAWSIWLEYAAATIQPPANGSWNGMQVRCKITDANDNSVYSDAATITILPTNESDFRILTQPRSLILDKSTLGSRNVAFTVDANGSAMTYQWYYRKSGQAVWHSWDGHNTASTSARLDTTWDGAQLYCLITNGDGQQLYSDIARITISSQVIVITAQPQNVSTKPDRQVTFSVSANGTGLTYLWYYMKSGSRSWSAWSEYTAATIQPPANDTWNGMQVRCRITDTYGNSIESQPATVKILPYESGDFRIVSHPSNQVRYTSDLENYYAGSGPSVVPFYVKAEGTNLTYQWYYREKNQTAWTKWEGQTKDVASFEVRGWDFTWNGRQVYCLVTNGDGQQLCSKIAGVSIIMDN